MRARLFTGGTTPMLNAQIALGGFDNGGSRILVKDERALGRADFHHANVVIRTAVCARRTTDTREIVDEDVSRFFVPPNGTSGTTDHAHRINTMHARVGKHQISV